MDDLNKSFEECEKHVRESVSGDYFKFVRDISFEELAESKTAKDFDDPKSMPFKIWQACAVMKDKEIEHCRNFYTARMQRIKDYLVLNDHWNDKTASIFANGTESSRENPSYAQLISIKDHKIQSLESQLKERNEALIDLASALETTWPGEQGVAVELFHTAFLSKHQSLINQIKESRK